MSRKVLTKEEYDSILEHANRVLETSQMPPYDRKDPISIIAYCSEGLSSSLLHFGNPRDVVIARFHGAVIGYLSRSDKIDTYALHGQFHDYENREDQVKKFLVDIKHIEDLDYKI